MAQSLFPPLGLPIRPPVSVSNLRRNLEALLGPRLKVSVRKFGKLAPLKLLAASERRGLVCQPVSFHTQLKGCLSVEKF